MKKIFNINIPVGIMMFSFVFAVLSLIAVVIIKADKEKTCLFNSALVNKTINAEMIEKNKVSLNKFKIQEKFIQQVLINVSQENGCNEVFTYNAVIIAPNPVDLTNEVMVKAGLKH